MIITIRRENDQSQYCTYISSSTCTGNGTQFNIIIYCSRLFDVLCSSSYHLCIAQTSLPSIASGAEALCSMRFLVKPTWSHDYMGNIKILIWSYGEVFELTQGLDQKTKKANAICVNALGKPNHFSNSVVCDHNLMGFPLSDACFKDLRHAKDKKKASTKWNFKFRQLYSSPLKTNQLCPTKINYVYVLCLPRDF